MDVWLLDTLVRRLDAGLRGAVISGVAEEGAARWSWALDREDGPRAHLVVSLAADGPWVGLAQARWPGGGTSSVGPFTAQARSLRGRAVRGLVREPADRCVRLLLSGGGQLIAELVPHGGNLVIVGGDGRVVQAARSPRRARNRLVAGEPYAPPRPPGPDWLEQDEATLSARLGGPAATLDAVAARRCLPGLDLVTARALGADEELSATTWALRLSQQVAAVRAGRSHPVLEVVGDPASAADAGRLDPDELRLLPFTPDAPAPEGWRRIEGPAAELAWRRYDPVDRQRLFERRARGLLQVLELEGKRRTSAAARVATDLEAFRDPDDHRRGAEALLAGVTSAQRHGDAWRVPDPWNPGSFVDVPAPAGLGPTDAADRLFQLHRRARRGRERAAERLAQLRRERDSLAELRRAYDADPGLAGLERLQTAMRGQGIPVGIVAPTRKGREHARTGRVRLEGLRMFTSTDGWTVLVGRTARENQRLTFRLAGPDDFWLHAQDVAGAHVVIRNPGRESEPPRATLREAAEAAAWYSDGRGAAQADVQWTRRKNVRKLRGAPPGTVRIKRFRTLRVRPTAPGSNEDVASPVEPRET